MSKLYIEETFIENSILPRIEQSITKLNKAVNGVGSLNVPDDFEYANYLKSLLNKNNDSLIDLIDKKNKLEKIVKNLKNIEKTNCENYEEIKILNVPIRNTLVNKE